MPLHLQHTSATWFFGLINVEAHQAWNSECRSWYERGKGCVYVQSPSYIPRNNDKGKIVV
jgi:hypothetical protein